MEFVAVNANATEDAAASAGRIAYENICGYIRDEVRPNLSRCAL
jgi:hypothetical protein